jgi:hypothetical protein
VDKAEIEDAVRDLLGTIIGRVVFPLIRPLCPDIPTYIRQSREQEP